MVTKTDDKALHRTAKSAASELCVKRKLIKLGKCESNEKAERRLKAIEGIPLLKLTDSAVELSRKLISGNALPTKATDDALHIALSAVHNIDYLLTWNCRHIDNAEIKPLVRSIIIVNGYNYPEICTPQELIGGDSDEE